MIVVYKVHNLLLDFDFDGNITYKTNNLSLTFINYD